MFNSFINRLFIVLSTKFRYNENPETSYKSFRFQVSKKSFSVNIHKLKFSGRMVYGEFEPPEMFQIDDMWVLLAADHEETQRHGLVTIVDFEGMSWRFLRYYTPWYIRAGTCKLEVS